MSNNKLGQFDKPTKKCKDCEFFVENGLGMRYCNAPLAVICDKDDNKQAPRSIQQRRMQKAYEDYYESRLSL